MVDRGVVTCRHATCVRNKGILWSQKISLSHSIPYWYYCKRNTSRFGSRTIEKPLTVVSRAAQDLNQLDDELSKRPLSLDPQGYFIISIDRTERVIVAEHYGNTINDKGLACDEETGEVIGCGGATQTPRRRFSARTAKELSVMILEHETGLCSRLEHANYLGREFQKAQVALLTGSEYIQD